MKMKNPIITMLLFIFALSSVAQELSPVHLKDTTLSLVQLYEPEFVFEQSLHFAPLPINVPQRFPEYFYRPSTIAPQPLSWELQNKIDIAAPWKLQLAEENEHRTLYMILGSVSTGGALYIAYRHVKKYGFW